MAGSCRRHQAADNVAVDLDVSVTPDASAIWLRRRGPDEGDLDSLGGWAAGPCDDARAGGASSTSAELADSMRSRPVQVSAGVSVRLIVARPRRRIGNLPAEATSFVGRRRELAETRKTLAGARLVSLVGPGGVGKTRLGIRVATDLGRGFAGRSMVGGTRRDPGRRPGDQRRGRSARPSGPGRDESAAGPVVPSAG